MTPFGGASRERNIYGRFRLWKKNGFGRAY